MCLYGPLQELDTLSSIYIMNSCNEQSNNNLFMDTGEYHQKGNLKNMGRGKGKRKYLKPSYFSNTLILVILTSALQIAKFNMR